MPGYLRHFLACNNYQKDAHIPFCIGARPFGQVRRDIASFLAKNSDHLSLSDQALTLRDHVQTPEARTLALVSIVDKLATHTSINKKLRGEIFPIKNNFDDHPVALIDRAAVPWFGLRAWGVHVNGYVKKNGNIFLWIGERAADRIIEPGKLDHIAAGGQPHGISLDDNLIKEAKEEANIPPELAKTAKLVGSISYQNQQPDGLRNDTLFIYDLELPEAFQPINTDGEVAAFHLMPLEEIDTLIRTTDRVKFNVNMVITDFLIRHGFLTKTEPEWDQIMPYLRDAAGNPAHARTSSGEAPSPR